jgi:hypothetical protein
VSEFSISVISRYEYRNVARAARGGEFGWQSRVNLCSENVTRGVVNKARHGSDS